MVEENQSRWRRFVLIVKVIEVRLRFIAILVVTGLVIGWWDTIRNHWDRWTRAPIPAATALAADTELYCPMDPKVVRAGLEPNGRIPRCPICGMPLATRRKGDTAPLGSGVTGRVQLSPDRIRLLGARVETLEMRALAREITTVGTVQYDEGRLSRIVARTSGYIERLVVDKNFTPVKEGDPLAEVYSPELYTSVRELMIAKRSGSAELVESAREKLELLGLDRRELDRIVETGKPSYRITIRSPRTGHVIERAIVTGAHVLTGATLFEVADLSKVWIEAELFERDIPSVKEGQAVEASLDAFPNRVFNGTVAFVHPHLDAQTRTNTLRFELANAQHELRPGMFATVRVQVPLGEVLAVPERAVIDTGTRKVVYVEREVGVFEGLVVELGPRVGPYYPVVRGLAAGDRVASSGSFLIDAETRLNPAAGGTFTGATGAPRAERSPTPRGVEPAAGPGELDAPGLAKLPPAKRALATAQKVCPQSGDLLGSMGAPHEVVLADGRSIFVCCQACEADVKSDPEKAFEKIRRQGGGR